jgi:hypothetical protein
MIPPVLVAAEELYREGLTLAPQSKAKTRGARARKGATAAPMHVDYHFLQTIQLKPCSRVLQACATPVPSLHLAQNLSHNFSWPGRKLPVAELAEDVQPAGAGSAECTVLCAKVLTNSDASSGRIILPRIYVEANLSFVIGYRCWLNPLAPT